LVSQVSSGGNLVADLGAELALVWAAQLDLAGAHLAATSVTAFLQRALAEEHDAAFDDCPSSSTKNTGAIMANSIAAEPLLASARQART